MNYDDSQGRLPIGLPMASAQHAYAWLDFDQALLVRRQREMPLNQITADGLPMAAAQEPPGHKLSEIGLRKDHGLILNGAEQ
jgi:hypothetical protein